MNVPKMITDIWFPFTWSPEKIWQLDLPIAIMTIDQLTWHLDYPLWSNDGIKAMVTPKEVLANPFNHQDRFQKMMAADLRFPIEIIWWSQRWMILDGVHRLTKSVYIGKKSVRVRKIPHQSIPQIID